MGYNICMFEKKQKGSSASSATSTTQPTTNKPIFTNPGALRAPGFKPQFNRGGFNPSTFKTQHKG